ncbi:MAG: ABC transporter ATP-binding protein [Bdellovibrionaceae bacterium]|nr:ABC transporter ATP-binding protein [Pseudobdellovibrionaceae bacterium]
MSSPRLLAEILFTRPWFRVLLISLSAGSAVAGLFAAFAQKEFVDLMLGKALLIEGLELHPIAWLAASFVGLLLSLVLSQAVNYVGAKESLWMQGRLAQRLYDRILKLQSSDLRGRSVGEIVAIYTTDIPGATILVEQSMPQCFNILFPLILAPAALVYLFELPLSFVIAVLAGVIAINLVLALRQSRFFSIFKRLAAERVGLVNEWVQNIRTLRVLGLMEPFETKLLEVREIETMNRIKMVTNGQTMNAVSSSMTFVINVLFILVLVRLHPAQVTPGSLLALLWIVGIFMTRPFRQIPWFFTFVFDGWTSLKRLAGALSLTSVPPQIAKSATVANEPALTVRDLNLRIYGQQLLSGIDLDLREGEFVAVVGEVGSGKSLLFQCLLAEAPAEFKAYRILGEDMSGRGSPEIRRHFAFVPQEGFTMSATLLENVAFDYHSKTTEETLREEIEGALALAEFRSSQERMNGGLTTEIGERGVNLSGGQKQRISLARAVYSKAPILLLDDTFSALDTETETKLIDGLFATRWKNRTCLLATHRLSVLSKVSRIYFMGEGRILDVGTWSELRGRSKAFNDFVHSVEAREAAQTPAITKSAPRPAPAEEILPPENPAEVISED